MVLAKGSPRTLRVTRAWRPGLSWPKGPQGAEGLLGTGRRPSKPREKAATQFDTRTLPCCTAPSQRSPLRHWISEKSSRNCTSGNRSCLYVSACILPKCH